MATYRIPEGELSLAHAAKTSGEHFAVRQENSSNGPGTLMSLVLLLSAKHTITHHNTAHIHSNWAAECFESSKHISIKARETRQSMSFRNYFIQSLQLKFINPICLFTSTHRNDLFLARVDDPEFLVLAGGADEAAVAVPADAEDDVRVHVLQGDHGLSRPHIPDDNHIITACRQAHKKTHEMGKQSHLRLKMLFIRKQLFPFKLFFDRHG